jgi:hypothetical protein
MIFSKTLRLRLFSLLRLPMLASTRPTVMEWSERSVTIRIPHSRRNRNFRNALAFGPILTAAECAAAILFGEAILARKSRVGYVVSGCQVSLKREFKSAGSFVAKLEKPAGDYIEAVEKSGAGLKVAVKVTGLDESGQVCAELEFEVALQAPKTRIKA